ADQRALPPRPDQRSDGGRQCRRGAQKHHPVLTEATMRIKDARTWVVANPPPMTGGRYFIFVRLTTDGGVTGYGEAYNATFGPHVTARMIEDVAERHLVGHDARDVEAFFRRCYSSGFSQRPDISMMGC